MVKVLCAGMPKSGTKTTAKALRLLGYNNVYDYEEHLLIFFDEYEKILQGKGDFNALLDKYEEHNVDCVVDAPTCFYFEQVHKRWPKAKVILMVRNEDEWFNSFRNMIHFAITKYMWLRYFSRTARRFLDWTRTLFSFMMGSREPNDVLWKMHYRRHNQYVKSVIPESQLCIYNVKEGWEPLCKFLNKPVPSTPFPFENKAEAAGNLVDRTLSESPIAKKMRNEVVVSLILYLIVLFVFGYGISTYFSFKSISI